MRKTSKVWTYRDKHFSIVENGKLSEKGKGKREKDGFFF